MDFFRNKWVVDLGGDEGRIIGWEEVIWEVFLGGN